MKKWSLIGKGKQSGLYIIDNFLTPQECAMLRQHVKKAGIASAGFKYRKGDKRIQKKVLYATLDYDANKTALKLSRKASQLTGFPADHGEPLKIVCYPPGGAINYHNDYMTDRKNPTNGRIAQILFYLNDVENGGETCFPNLGLKIIPKLGRAVLWYGSKECLPLKMEKNHKAFQRLIKKIPMLYTALFLSPRKKLNTLLLCRFTVKNGWIRQRLSFHAEATTTS